MRGKRQGERCKESLRRRAHLAGDGDVLIVLDRLTAVCGGDGEGGVWWKGDRRSQRSTHMLLWCVCACV